MRKSCLLQVLFRAKLLFPKKFNPIKLPLFCHEVYGLCFYRLFHWCLESWLFLARLLIFCLLSKCASVNVIYLERMHQHVPCSKYVTLDYSCCCWYFLWVCAVSLEMKFLSCAWVKVSAWGQVNASSWLTSWMHLNVHSLLPVYFITWLCH